MAQINPRKSAETYWLNRLQPIESIDMYSDKDAVADAQRVMDEELAAMEKVLCNVRSRRNSLSPISRLPTAILAYVFSFCAKIEPHSPWCYEQGTTRGYRAAHEMGWIKVSWVSSHWRDTALQAPSLWANIRFGLQSWRWVEEFACRAKTAPRAIEGDNLSHELIQKIRDGGFLPDGLPDVAHLYIAGGAEAFNELLTRPAPILESLVLRSVSYFGTEGHERDGPIIRLSNNLFAGDAPNLIHISLNNCYLPWTSSLFKDLTVLDIRLDLYNGTDNPDTRLSDFEQFFAIFRMMPRLEELVLHSCLPSLPKHGAISVGYDTVDLQHLVSLWLDGPILDCADFIQHVRFPPSAMVTLQCSTADFDGDIGDFLPALQVVAKRDVAWLTMKIGYSAHFFQVIALRSCDDGPEWYTEGGPEITGRPSGSEADIILSMNICPVEPNNGTLPPLWDPLLCHEIIEILCQAVPLDDLQALSVQCDRDPLYHLRPRQWTDLFGSSMKIVRVHTSKSIMCTSLINALVMDARPDQKQGGHQAAEQPPLLFPNLISVCLQNSPLQEEALVHDPAFGELLLRRLAERKSAGAGLEQLYLHRYYFYWENFDDGDNSIIPDLRQIVPIVVANGIAACPW